MLRPRAFASVFFAALMIIGTIQSARAQTVPLTASSPEPTPAANATPAPHRDGLAIAFAGAVVAFLLVEVVHCSTKAGGAAVAAVVRTTAPIRRDRILMMHAAAGYRSQSAFRFRYTFKCRTRIAVKRSRQFSHRNSVSFSMPLTTSGSSPSRPSPGWTYLNTSVCDHPCPRR